MTQIASFTINYTRFLDPQGKVTQPLPDFAKDPNILLRLYRLMVLTRTFDTKAITLQRTGKMGTYASTLGQEAVSVGFGSVMHPDDILCPAYREYGAQFQRGVKMSEILGYWGGLEQSNCYAACKEDFPIAVPIGSQCLHAVGAAIAFKYRKQARVAVSVCGDGATSQGDFYEAMNAAGVWNLPVIFIINNNQWAISVPRHQQTHTETLAQKGIAAGIPSEQVDGNDVIAIRHVMQRALDRARQGGGPSVIEALTYRLHDHTTADDATRYRDKAELIQAQTEEPIRRLRTYLIEEGWWSNEEEEKLLSECAKTVESAVQDYFQLPPEPVEAMFDYLYQTCPTALHEQRDTAIYYADTQTEASHHG